MTNEAIREQVGQDVRDALDLIESHFEVNFAINDVYPGTWTLLGIYPQKRQDCGMEDDGAICWVSARHPDDIDRANHLANLPEGDIMGYLDNLESERTEKNAQLEEILSSQDTSIKQSRELRNLHEALTIIERDIAALRLAKISAYSRSVLQKS